MTQDEIISMAKECGVHEYGPLTRNWSFELSQFERFAALVAAHEREACAKVCEEMIASVITKPMPLRDIVTAIRARG